MRQAHADGLVGLGEARRPLFAPSMPRRGVEAHALIVARVHHGHALTSHELSRLAELARREGRRGVVAAVHVSSLVH